MAFFIFDLWFAGQKQKLEPVIEAIGHRSHRQKPALYPLWEVASRDRNAYPTTTCCTCFKNHVQVQAIAATKSLQQPARLLTLKWSQPQAITCSTSCCPRREHFRSRSIKIRHRGNFDGLWLRSLAQAFVSALQTKDQR